MKVNTAQIETLLTDVLLAKQVPMVLGSPGIGKTDIIKSIADKWNLEPIIFCLATRDPTELIGYPTLSLDRERSSTAPPVYFPIEGDPLPEGKDGWLLFFDEMNSAPQMMQAASYQIILDRLVGFKKLHPNVAMVAAGNLETDNAIANSLSTAMQSRMIHFELEVNVERWITWAYEAEIDYRVIAMIKWRPELLHKFDPNHDDHTFPAPRTWHFLSNIIKSWTTINQTKLPILTGTIGEGAGIEFYGFVEIMESLPSIEEMLANPSTVTISSEPSTLYAITGLLEHHVTSNNINKIMQVINRLPFEFQTICIQGIIKKDITLYETKEIQEWSNNNYGLLTGY